LVNIWRTYKQSQSEMFFWDTVYMNQPQRSVITNMLAKKSSLYKWCVVRHTKHADSSFPCANCHIFQPLLPASFRGCRLDL